VFTGEVYKKHYVKIGNVQIPIWGFFEPEYKLKKEYDAERPAYFFKWKLPISYVGKTIHEAEMVERNYDEEEAVEEALVIGKRELKEKLAEDATIIGEKVLHHETENGKVKVSIHYQVIENIVKIEPIIQGD
jgi:similar to stage IV sporulation protein